MWLHGKSQYSFKILGPLHSNPALLELRRSLTLESMHIKWNDSHIVCSIFKTALAYLTLSNPSLFLRVPRRRFYVLLNKNKKNYTWVPIQWYNTWNSFGSKKIESIIDCLTFLKWYGFSFHSQNTNEKHKTYQRCAHLSFCWERGKEGKKEIVIHWTLKTWQK